MSLPSRHIGGKSPYTLQWAAFSPSKLPLPTGDTEKGKKKEEYLYSAFLAKVVHSKRSGTDHTVLPANNTMPAFPS